MPAYAPENQIRPLTISTWATVVERETGERLDGLRKPNVRAVMKFAFEFVDAFEGPAQ